MRGVSRTSFAELRDRLSEVLPDSGRPTSPAASGRTGSGRAAATGTAATGAAATGAAALGEDLFAVLRLLDREHALRRALADPAKPADEKGAVAAALFHGKVTAPAEELITTAVRSRWASPGDMTDAIEQVAVEAFAAAAEADGQLDDLEDELFRFGRVVAGQPELRAALSGSAVPPDRKQELLGALLDGKVTPVALRLITEMSLHPRGRSLPASLDMCTRIAARRRERLIAVVRVASEPTPAQRRRLAEALAANYGHDVYINIVVDPAVMGGMTIQIGDELIDASVASRLAAVRRRLAG
ncbi:MAG TPA: F0F1 ATP synthase subunit delta [Streptosporangiaceae bacterium]|jgi:F-type H+-transporting ATPase subunit delta|nr:F0F1 ATP synthase subunit delta [Streptosporangiaceae bacterium]